MRRSTPIMAAALLAALCALPTLARGADGGPSPTADAGPPDAPPPGPPPAQGPPPAIQMTCAPDPVRIGERLVCTLTAVHRPEVSIEVTAPERLAVDPPTPAKPRADGLLETVRTLGVRPDSMKKVRVRGLSVVYTEATGGQGTVAVPPQVVPVGSVLGGATDPKFRTFETPTGGAEGEDAAARDGFFQRHGPLPYRVFNWPLFIALCVLGGVGLGVGVGVLVKRYLDGRRVEPGPPVDPRPAHVIAFDELNALIDEKLPEEGRVGEYYVRLSEIIRRYLGRRYDIDAPEMTSDQIRVWTTLNPDSMDTQARLGLDDFLATTDLVKFADFSPGASEIETVTRQARGLITLTRWTAPGAPSDGPSAFGAPSAVDAPEGDAPEGDAPEAGTPEGEGPEADRPDPKKTAPDADEEGRA